MYELIQVSQDCFYIQSPAKIGLVRLGDNRVCLIDSGNDKDAGKKIRKILDAQGWTLQAIYNTHSHADHIGGNKYLQGQTGCSIYAPETECDFTRHPILEPSFLYGANPPKELRHKFMMAQESDALPLTMEVLPDGLSMLELSGHSFNMVGFRTKDDIVYLADCLSSKETLQKYQIGFLVDVGAYLETLEKVKQMEAALFIPAHADATQDIVPLAQINIDKVNEIADQIVTLCSEPVSFEGLLSKLFTLYDLKMTFEQHALVGSTVRSYLTYLANKGIIHPEVHDNMLLWSRS